MAGRTVEPLRFHSACETFSAHLSAMDFPFFLPWLLLKLFSVTCDQNRLCEKRNENLISHNQEQKEEKPNPPSPDPDTISFFTQGRSNPTFPKSSSPARFCLGTTN
jgi:hypothetical protein